MTASEGTYDRHTMAFINPCHLVSDSCQVCLEIPTCAKRKAAPHLFSADCTPGYNLKLELSLV